MQFPLFAIYRDSINAPDSYHCIVFGETGTVRWTQRYVEVFTVTDEHRPLKIDFIRCDSVIVSSLRYADPYTEAQRLDQEHAELLRECYRECVHSRLARLDSKVDKVCWASLERQTCEQFCVNCNVRLRITNPADLEDANANSSWPTEGGVSRLDDLNSRIKSEVCQRGFLPGDFLPCYLDRGCGLLELLGSKGLTQSFNAKLHLCSTDGAELGSLLTNSLLYWSRKPGKLPRVLAECACSHAS